MAREWPTVDGLTVHMIGDVHWGHIYQTRLAKMLADLERGYEDSPPAMRIQVGDGTHYTQQLQLEGFIAWMDSLPDAQRIEPISGRTWAAIMGNHDVVTDVLTRTDEPDSYGYNGVGGDWQTETGWTDAYSIDLGWVRLLMVSWNPTAPGTSPKLSSAQYTWMDSELTAAGSQECWIVCHAPLHDSVLGPHEGRNSVYDSRVDGFYVKGPDNTTSQIDNLIAAHDNARAWFSGHTHSPITSEGLITSVTLGGKEVAVVNCSALIWSYEDENERFSDVRSLYVRREDDGLAISFRDHGIGAWTGAAPDKRVVRVEL